MSRKSDIKTFELLLSKSLDGPPSAPCEKTPQDIPDLKLEDELEEIANDWEPTKRLHAARKMYRWANQLRVSALISLLNRKARMKGRYGSLRAKDTLFN